MLNTFLSWLIGVGTFLFGLSFIVHICSKSKYSIKYESVKRKIEIYPNSKDKPQTTNKTTIE